MNDLGRACDKFNNAVYALAAGRGDIKERLADAFVRYLVDINESDMPESLRGEFHDLHGAHESGAVSNRT